MKLRPPHFGWVILGMSLALAGWGFALTLAIALAPVKAELRTCTDSLFVTDGSGRVYNPRRAEFPRDTTASHAGRARRD